MGCVYAADSVWQGVVGGWCSTTIIWAQGWRVTEEKLLKGGRSAAVVFTSVKFCRRATAITPFFGGEMMNEFICIFLL